MRISLRLIAAVLASAGWSASVICAFVVIVAQCLNPQDNVGSQSNLVTFYASTSMNSTVKRFSKTTSSIILLSAVIVALGNVPTTHAQAPAEAAKSAESLRPEVAAPLKAAQDFINAKQFKEGLAKLAEAEAIASKTPYETYILERLRGPTAAAIGETAVATKSFQFAYDSGRLNPAERIQFSEVLGSSFFKIKDFKTAAIWCKRALENGSTSKAIHALLIRALLLSEDFAKATVEINSIIADDQKAGRISTQEIFLLASTAAFKQNDDLAYIAALEQLALHYPSKEYWTDFIGRIARLPGINDRYMPDIFRLKLTLGQTLTAGQYVFIAQSSKQGGFPIDAAKVMEAGFKAGVLSTAEHKQLYDLVVKDAADDIKNMARTSAEAAKAKEGPGLFNSGLNYVYNGEGDKGLNMMEQGIKRPGIRRPEDARLRLGIAYALSGERDAAVETLAQVKSAEGAAEVARLWTAYAKQKSAVSTPSPLVAPSAPSAPSAPTK